MVDRSHYFAVGAPWSTEMLHDWRWLIGDTAFVISRVTAMGSLFLLHPSGGVYFLDTAHAIFEPIASSEEAIDSLFDSSYQRKLRFWTFRVRQFRQDGQVLGTGQCYSPKVPLCLGGKLESGAVECCDVAAHVSLHGQVHQRVRRLASGATIDRIEVR